MNREHLILGTLFSLYDLAGELPRGRHARHAASRSLTIAGRLGVSSEAVRAALAHLEGKGLVDADHVRLTLKGLAVAAAFRAHRAETQRAA